VRSLVPTPAREWRPRTGPKILNDSIIADTHAFAVRVGWRRAESIVAEPPRAGGQAFRAGRPEIVGQDLKTLAYGCPGGVLGVLNSLAPRAVSKRSGR
jgi:hypothetical protein